MIENNMIPLHLINHIEEIRNLVKKVSVRSGVLSKVEEFIYDQENTDNVPMDNYFVLWQLYQTVKHRQDSNHIFAQVSPEDVVDEEEEETYEDLEEDQDD